ncbi:PRA1 family protein B1 [Acorus calamus]|uniref:PRA1 family protein n=1 Tax=Acorus calamus TaxID=4465 RepID=A0AAV9EFD8_ACOCL|nr:PRA1 family protein B1 [Acorus calamus]KAK1312366.1 PRA1 family protein B1 [Acorus calamus]
MASPPPLPMTTAQASAASTGTAAAPSTALRSFISRLADTSHRAFARRRPWLEMLDRSAFARPESATDALSRLKKNVSYFKINYVAFLALVLALSLLSHPLSLVTLLSLSAAWSFLYLFRPSDPPLVLFGRTFSDRETLGGLILLTIIVVFLTSVGSLLISALMVGAALVCVHGALRVPEDLFLDEAEPTVAAAGFLNFLGGAASSAAAAAAPVVAARV